MVEALFYKPEGCGFDSRWGSLIFFSVPNPSSHTMAPEFTKRVTEMNTGRFPGIKRGRCVRLTT
jgi:hypothetical protein